MENINFRRGSAGYGGNACFINGVFLLFTLNHISKYVIDV